ncbi:MAG: isoamylase early set domain-containing protein [Candidatus Latescibacteria bacterium]|nr:isoamylase early set domain-containing protein [Candidatus Latescibacterota bacterium]
MYFKLVAPEAGEVFLVGTFNNWDPKGRPLKRGKAGLWRTFMSLEPGTYEYRFVVDGLWHNDPGARAVPNPYGGLNCCVEVLP